MKRLICLFCALQVFAAACTQQIAGTSNGSETTNGVTATVRNQEGAPAVGALVKTAPAALTPDDESWIVYETHTDSFGHFTISSLRPGRYTADIFSQNGEDATVVQGITVSDSIVRLDDPVLSPAAFISGAVQGADDGTHVVCIEGLDRKATTLGAGYFYFGRIAPGKYTIGIKETNTATLTFLREIVTAPSEKVVLDDIDPISGTFTRHEGVIADPDSLAVAAFLRKQGIAYSEWDSIVIIEEEKIRGLSLADRNLDRLDPSIGECRSIQSLDLSNNALTDLPSTLSWLPRIHTLRLNSNAFAALPAVVAEIPVLIRLNVENNRLTALPQAFSKLAFLESLVLSENRFTEVPPQILSCKKLRWLKLYRNPIDAIPEELYDLVDLQKLGLSYTNIDRLSSRIGNLSRLQMLDIAKCGLDSLPHEIGMLSQLTQLWATGNDFTSLPASFSRLTSLNSLQLSNCRLVALPENFGSLTSLRELYLNGNELTSLPASITSAQSLESLLVGGNSICNPTPDVAGWLDLFAESDWKNEQVGCD